MNSKFTPLDCDDDVILLERDTFTVDRLKELSNQAIINKLNYSMNGGISNKYSTSALDFFSSLSLGEQKISFSEIQFNYLKDCQILKIGGKGWQKGKLKINICISPNAINPDKVCLEFCPDEQIEPESPLDDIRKLVEQK
jgi:hypothetical protein